MTDGSDVCTKLNGPGSKIIKPYSPLGTRESFRNS